MSKSSDFALFKTLPREQLLVHLHAAYRLTAYLQELNSLLRDKNARLEQRLAGKQQSEQSDVEEISHVIQ